MKPLTLPAALLFLAAGLLHAPRAAAAQEPGNLEAKAAEWLVLLSNADFDSAAARVAPVARGSMSAAQLALIWPQIRERFGELEKTAPVNRIEQGGYVVVLLLGSFSKGARTIRVAFDKDGLVAGFVVGPPAGSPPPA